MDFSSLFENIKSTHLTLQKSASNAINLSITIRNWIIGYYIIEFEQNGADRAAYGEKLLKNLAKKFENTHIKGMTERRFREYRRFYTVYPHIGEVINDFIPQDAIRQLPTAKFANHEIRRLPTAELDADLYFNTPIIPSEKLISKLSYSHFAEIAKIDDPLKRVFYEMESIKGNWSVKELERQIYSLYYERSGLSKDKTKLSNIVNEKAVELIPKDILNNPVAIEFLGLNDRALVTESDLEQAILDNLQWFLLEMGHGFCFEARQKRILIDEDYYFIDLVFYHRILKCHVLVDLKTEKFKHGHASQLNTYLEFFKNEVQQKDDNPPVGILLCTDKGSTLVKYATAGLEDSIFVHKYLIELPKKEELEEYIRKELI
jgi:predicted nuclease of restriction endonuclease-like (RecB) superfamily